MVRFASYRFLRGVHYEKKGSSVYIAGYCMAKDNCGEMFVGLVIMISVSIVIYGLCKLVRKLF